VQFRRFRKELDLRDAEYGRATMQHKSGRGQRRGMGDTDQQNLEFGPALCLWSLQMPD
jgi:hypothetical protein